MISITQGADFTPLVHESSQVASVYHLSTHHEVITSNSSKFSTSEGLTTTSIIQLFKTAIEN